MYLETYKRIYIQGDLSLLIFIFKHHTTGFIERKIFQKIIPRLYAADEIHTDFGY